MNIYHKVEVDGQNYIIYRLPLDDSFDGFDLITKIYGEGLLDIFTSLLSNVSNLKDLGNIGNKNFDNEKIILAIKTYSNKVNVGDTKKVIKFFLGRPNLIKVGEAGEGININKVFNERGLLHVTKLLFNVIQWQYLDFLFSGREKATDSKNQDQLQSNITIQS